MRGVVMLVAVCALGGCKEEPPVAVAPTGPALQGGQAVMARCRQTVRLPQSLVMVSHPEAAPVPCGHHPLCFAGSGSVMAIWGEDDVVRVNCGNLRRDYPPAEQARGAEGNRLAALLRASKATAVVALKDRVVFLDGRHGEERSFPTPGLLPGETLARALVMSGGYGVATTGPGPAGRNIWFSRPPTVPEEFLQEHWIVDEDGELRGRLTARAGQVWFIDGLASREWLVGPDVGGRLRVSVVGSRVLVFHGATVHVFDGGERWTLQPRPASLLLASPARVYVLDPWEGLRLADRSGARVVLELSPTHDLAGAALPPGTERERFQAAVHDDELLVIERVRSADCRAEDRVHLLTTTAQGIRVETLASGDRVRMHPGYALGAFHWLEAAPRYVQQDAQDTAVFDATEQP